MDYDTGIGDAGLIPQHIFQNASLAAYRIWESAEPKAEWVGDLRSTYSAALNEGRSGYAAALAYEAMIYADTPDEQFDLLNLQGIAMTAMIEAGGPQELYDFRIAAFEKALLALPEDRGWTHSDMLCRIRLANANLEYGVITQTAILLEAARDEYAALLPALREGRWGYSMHAKAAELAVLLAQSVDAIVQLGAEPDPWPEGMRAAKVNPDPLPHWLLALELALDPKLRATDTLGYWDAAMDPLEKWLDELRYKPEAKLAGREIVQVFQKLSLPPDNPDHGWVQYYIGVFAMAAGLQTDGLRSEAKDAGDEDALVSSVAGYRKALAAIEADSTGNWPSTAFQLAYALHSLGEARCDVPSLDEAVGLYEQVVRRLADAHDEEDSLLLAQTQVNLSEAMAKKAQITGDAALARRALGIAADGEMGFTLWAHDEGIEVAQANCARISDIIDEIESR